MRRVLTLIVILLLSGCVRLEVPIRPRPTVSPLDVPITTVIAPQWSLRAVSAPDAPVLEATSSAVVNVVCVGDCVVGGGPSWVTSDVVVGWTHPDPANVDEYEVWRATDEPYFDPDTCSLCELVATTTGLVTVVEDSPPGFNPVMASAGSQVRSEMDTYVVRARNAGGVSDVSNEIGVVSYSLLQGGSGLPEMP